MKLLKTDFKQGIVGLRLTQREDAWHLFKLITSGDLLSGKAERKIKLGGEGEKGTVLKKTLWLEIKVEKTDLQGDELRANGTVCQDYDDIPKGSYQGISLSLHDDATLKKESWGMLDRQRLEQATQDASSDIIAVVFDREEAYYAQLTHEGFTLLVHEKGDVAKKGNEEGKGDFFKQIAATLSAIAERTRATQIIIASPSFWKEYLVKELASDVKKKSVLATVSSCDETSFHELMKRPELEQVLSRDRSAQEEKTLEDAFAAVRNDLACYGAKELEEAVAQGNLKDILVAEERFTKTSPEEKGALETFLASVESVGGHIHILTQDASQKKLQPFKGVLGIKRWKTS